MVLPCRGKYHITLCTPNWDSCVVVVKRGWRWREGEGGGGKWREGGHLENEGRWREAEGRRWREGGHLEKEGWWRVEDNICCSKGLGS